MSTDWKLVRAMMQSAIDVCERMEALGVGEGDRGTVVEIDCQRVSVFDIMTSAWTYPESLRSEIVRRRHEAGADQPYVPEAARILVNVAQSCAELVGGAGRAPAADEACRHMLRWYAEHALPNLEKAVGNREGADAS